MAALPNRLGIPRIKVPEIITVPRPVIRAGLLCKPGCTDIGAVIEVAKGHVWVTRWSTVGTELPYSQDWLWYMAILACYSNAVPSFLLLLQSKAEVYRLAHQLGAGTTGGAMARQAADALRRLCQAGFGWQRAEHGDGNTLASSQLTTSPILYLSSGLAEALWGKEAWPVGIQVTEDTRLWISPTLSHLAMTRDCSFKIPAPIIRDLAHRMDHMAIGLVIAAYAQATRDGYPVTRRTWETLVTRISDCPRDRVIRRVDEAASHLMAACDLAGFKNAIKVRFRPVKSPVREGVIGPGRPKARWSYFIWPAGKPFRR